MASCPATPLGGAPATTSTPAHRRAVTPAGHHPRVWAAAIAASAPVTLDALAQAGPRLLVVAAHPDDETLGAGRLVAQWAAQVGPVTAVTLTAGEACLDHLGHRDDTLGARRLGEWRAAVAALGVGDAQAWDVPDGEVGEALDIVTGRLRAVIERVGADVVLAPWSLDPHPDHRAAGLAATRAARGCGTEVLEYPVWMTYWSLPAALERAAYRLVHVPTDASAERARTSALAHYASQLEPLRDDLEPVVPAHLLAHHDRQLLLEECRR